MPLNKKGFTLVELMVVVAMIALIIGAVSYSISAAQNRARIQKATAEVKELTQAILAYENYQQKNELPTMQRVDAEMSSLGFLLGNGGEARGGKIPVLVSAALSSGGKVADPWGTPYKVTIKEGPDIRLDNPLSVQTLTGVFLPNFYRLSKKERGE